MKQQVFNHVKNLRGWKTRRRIVVFAVDDYGNVRVSSSLARERMNRAGLRVHSRFDAFDALENHHDLEALFEVLSSVKDKRGHAAVLTAFCVPCNINFEATLENGSFDYQKELLPATYKKREAADPKAYTGAWGLWKEGMEKKLIHPEYHGREHFNLKVFREKLQAGDRELMTALRHHSLTSISGTGYSTISFAAAYEFDRLEENSRFQYILLDGLDAFEQVFGFRARIFNPPGGREHPVIHRFLNEGGVKCLDTPFLKKEHQGRGKYKWILNYTGKKNALGQLFLVRNCVFEPNLNTHLDWIQYTFKQVETAFKWHRPAIISSHRVNFCGHIDPINRKKGLWALKKLLKKIVDRYPDVEFMTSLDLAHLIEQRKRKPPAHHNKSDIIMVK